MLLKQLRIIVACIFVIQAYPAVSQSYYSFDNISEGTAETVVNCFIQDASGLVWMGTGGGLCSYDGYNIRDHYSASGNTSTRIYCGTMISDAVLMLGGDLGVLLYDTVADKYIPIDGGEIANVRSICRTGDTVWVGTLDGLYTYRIAEGRFAAAGKDSLPHRAVYSLAYSDDGIVFIGTYDGLGKYDTGTGAYGNIAMPAMGGRNNQFVNSLLVDNAGEWLWIGTENGLYRYGLGSGEVAEIPGFGSNSVKSLVEDAAGNLVIGTDDGLYIYEPSNQGVRHIVHNSRDGSSLVNNIVWAVFRDRDGNIWLGTDSGVSLAPNTGASRFVPVSDITGVGDGNKFYAILRDSRGGLWLGGSNGLIYTDADMSPRNVRWYRMGDKKYPLPHNRIRDIYEDGSGRLWIASDGGVNLYDRVSGQFRRIDITDATGTRNANWAYRILEDRGGNYWISSYLGGVFMVDRSDMVSPSGSCTARSNWTSENGLAGDAANNMVPDGRGGIVVQCYPDGLQRIDIVTGEVSGFVVRAGDMDVSPDYLIRDKEGNLWASGHSWIIRVDAATGKQDAIFFDERLNGTVMAMDDSRDRLWIASSRGVYMLSKETLGIRRAEVAGRNYSAIYYDGTADMVYAGSTDGVLLFSPQMVAGNENPRPLYITSMQVNGEPLPDGTDGVSVRYTDRIELAHNRNNISFTVSDLVYSSEGRRGFVYRLDGLETEWTSAADNSNRISYSNLAPGSYHLVVRAILPDGKPSPRGADLHIRIRQPWYFSWPAKVIYFLLALGLGVWAVNFFRVRNKLRMERFRREQSLKLSNLKMDFFANASHEFKTPLSLIVGPLGKLIDETRNAETRRQLETIRRSALRLSSLTHQVLEFNRNDSGLERGVILSKIEVVEFARSIFETYEDGVKDKMLSFNFIAPGHKIYADIDIVKTESIINNLVSNACKYTPDGGSVSLGIGADEDAGMLVITVTDTGIGIPGEELPYIFGRFYESSATRDMNKGTGIGLYLVKQYSEVQGGDVAVSSQEGVGTSFTVRLPLVVSGQAESPRTTETDAGVEAPLVLVVEDNVEIASFIVGILSGQYRCEIAGNGRAGLEKCIGLKPDLVISDIMMPVMDGLEMCRAIRANVTTASVPIILLSARDDVRTQVESMKLDVNSFIPKPFDPELLLTRVEQLLAHETRLQAALRMEALTEPRSQEVVSDDEKFLIRITDMIENNISDPELNVNALTGLSGFSSKQVYRKIKQLTGTSPVDYIRTIRLKKAAMLLAQKKFSVSEVMYMVGFSNSSYFSKCFQQQFGKTPKQYMAESVPAGE